jgi:hypothetical protein
MGSRTNRTRICRTGFLFLLRFDCKAGAFLPYILSASVRNDGPFLNVAFLAESVERWGFQLSFIDFVQHKSGHPPTVAVQHIWY